MSVAVGLLELLGYLAPGASLVSVIALVFPRVQLEVGDSLLTQVVYLLASYIAGHALNVTSPLLTVIRTRLVGHRPRNAAYQARLRELLARDFGPDLGPSEEYHLSHALAIERCPRLGERIERYFALSLLMRNMTAAAFFAMLILAWTAQWSWAVLCAGFVGLFAYQHAQFDGTLQRAVFRTALVALMLPNLTDSRLPPSRTAAAGMSSAGMVPRS